MNIFKLSNLKKSFQELTWYEWLMCAIMVLIAAWAMVQGFMHGAADGNPAWLTVVNFISAVCGVICIFFCAKANISSFIFAIIKVDICRAWLQYDMIPSTGPQWPCWSKGG